MNRCYKFDFFLAATSSAAKANIWSFPQYAVGLRCHNILWMHAETISQSVNGTVVCHNADRTTISTNLAPACARRVNASGNVQPICTQSAHTCVYCRHDWSWSSIYSKYDHTDTAAAWPCKRGGGLGRCWQTGCIIFVTEGDVYWCCK